MYAREVDGQTLTLFVSGKLWLNSLVMGDKETESLWSHHLGQAMDGALQGATLDVIPSVMTDWKTWKELHPESTVVMLERTVDFYTRDKHRRRAAYLVGYSEGEPSRAWEFMRLAHHPVVNDEMGDTKILVWFDRVAGTVRLFDRKVDGQALTFVQRDGRIFDEQTQSEWDGLRGLAIDGPKSGTRLAQLPGIVSFVDTWKKFHPDSSMWKPSE